MNIYLLVKIRLGTLWASIRALKEVSQRRHDEARMSGTRKDKLRAEGDLADAQAEELKKAVDESLKRIDG